MPHYTAVVTLLAIALYGFMGMRVSAARRRFNVSLPATSGHPDFERVYRAHMNTLEWMPIFLVTLWLCAIYLSDVMAAAASWYAYDLAGASRFNSPSAPTRSLPAGMRALPG